MTSVQIVSFHVLLFAPCGCEHSGGHPGHHGQTSAPNQIFGLFWVPSLTQLPGAKGGESMAFCFVLFFKVYLSHPSTESGAQTSDGASQASQGAVVLMGHH